MSQHTLTNQLQNPSISQISQILVSSPTLQPPQIQTQTPYIVSTPLLQQPQIYTPGITATLQPQLPHPQLTLSLPTICSQPQIFSSLIAPPPTPTHIILAPLSHFPGRTSPQIRYPWYLNETNYLASLHVWGKWPADGKYFYRRGSKSVMMPLKKHYNAKSPLQLSLQAQFSQAVKAWQKLDTHTKQQWHFDCWKHRKRMTGFNWFISNYMRKTNYQPK